jgi:hypothetical protein
MMGSMGQRRERLPDPCARVSSHDRIDQRRLADAGGAAHHDGTALRDRAEHAPELVIPPLRHRPKVAKVVRTAPLILGTASG